MRKWVLAVLPLLLLTACRTLPQGREMGDMALMRTVGVDAAEDGTLRVTASSGHRARGIQGERQPSLVLSVESASLPGAMLAMQGMSESYVFFGQADQLLLGEGVQGDTLAQVLRAFEFDREISPGSRVWLVRDGSARSAIESGGEEGIDARLESLQEDSRMGTAGICVTVRECLSRLREDGSCYVPALRVEERDGSSTSLLECGYGVLRGDALCLWLEGDAAWGLELLEGSPGAQLLEMDGLSLRSTRSALRCACRWEEGRPAGLRLNLEITLQARGGGTLDAARLETARRRCEDSVRAALKLLRAEDCDCLSLLRRAGLSSPWRWPSLSGSLAFSSLPAELECHVHGDEGGEK